VQQPRGLCLVLCLAPAPRGCCACALISPASYFVTAVDVSSFFCGSAAPRLYCSDVQQRASCFGPPSMLGARYSPLLCVCSYCTCTSLCYKLSISAPSYSQARLFGGVALLCSSFAFRVSFYAWRPLLAAAVRVRSLHMHVISNWLSKSAPSSMLVRLLSYTALMRSSVVLRASFYARRPLLAVAVRVQLLHMHLSVS
jgi:hypothetical protein